jgi:pSer/pThr/pTyr-binding forkhead associated (FHA) protein
MVPSSIPLDELIALARRTTREDFCAQFAYPFLSPRQDTDESGAWSSLDWETDVRPYSTPKEREAPQPPRELRYLPLVTRPGSAYPGRVWVGRAPNCEVLLKHPSVSKLHAFFIANPDVRKWGLADARSANGTIVNGQRVEPLTEVPIAPGDLITFGDIETIFLDPGSIYERLEARAQVAGATR